MAYVLDTDVISALQHGHPMVLARVGALPSAAVYVTIVSFEEQVAGRLHVLSRQLPVSRLVEAYLRLDQTRHFFSEANVLHFDTAAAQCDESFRRLYPRMGTKDA
jgi:tRNA(fMet)-specific endonuclease VapC